MISIKPLSEKGYSLVLIIIITSILLLLGFTAITLSQNNLKMKIVNSRSKKNFYVAEALSQEVDMKLHEYLEESLDITYKKLLKDIEYEENSDIDIDLINKKFQQLYEEQVYETVKKLGNANNYNLKIIEQCNVSIDVKIEENLEINGFNMYVISTFKEQNILEKIQTDYIIHLPNYKDTKHNKQLIKKVGWVNSKW